MVNQQKLNQTLASDLVAAIDANNTEAIQVILQDVKTKFKNSFDIVHKVVRDVTISKRQIKAASNQSGALLIAAIYLIKYVHEYNLNHEEVFKTLISLQFLFDSVFVEDEIFSYLFALKGFVKEHLNVFVESSCLYDLIISMIQNTTKYCLSKSKNMSPSMYEIMTVTTDEVVWNYIMSPTVKSTIDDATKIKLMTYVSDCGINFIAQFSRKDVDYEQSSVLRQNLLQLIYRYGLNTQRFLDMNTVIIKRILPSKESDVMKQAIIQSICHSHNHLIQSLYQQRSKDNREIYNTLVNNETLTGMSNLCIHINYFLDMAHSVYEANMLTSFYEVCSSCRKWIAIHLLQYNEFPLQSRGIWKTYIKVDNCLHVFHDTILLSLTSESTSVSPNATSMILPDSFLTNSNTPPMHGQLVMDSNDDSIDVKLLPHLITILDLYWHIYHFIQLIKMSSDMPTNLDFQQYACITQEISMLNQTILSIYDNHINQVSESAEWKKFLMTNQRNYKILLCICQKKITALKGNSALKVGQLHLSLDMVIFIRDMLSLLVIDHNSLQEIVFPIIPYYLQYIVQAFNLLTAASWEYISSHGEESAIISLYTSLLTLMNRYEELVSSTDRTKMDSIVTLFSHIVTLLQSKALPSHHSYSVLSSYVEMTMSFLVLSYIHTSSDSSSRIDDQDTTPSLNTQIICVKLIKNIINIIADNCALLSSTADSIKLLSKIPIYRQLLAYHSFLQSSDCSANGTEDTMKEEGKSLFNTLIPYYVSANSSEEESSNIYKILEMIRLQEDESTESTSILVSLKANLEMKSVQSLGSLMAALVLCQHTSTLLLPNSDDSSSSQPDGESTLNLLKNSISTLSTYDIHDILCDDLGMVYIHILLSTISTSFYMLQIQGYSHNQMAIISFLSRLKDALNLYASSVYWHDIAHHCTQVCDELSMIWSLEETWYNYPSSHTTIPPCVSAVTAYFSSLQNSSYARKDTILVSLFQELEQANDLVNMFSTMCQQLLIHEITSNDSNERHTCMTSIITKHDFITMIEMVKKSVKDYIINTFKRSYHSHEVPVSDRNDIIKIQLAPYFAWILLWATKVMITIYNDYNVAFQHIEECMSWCLLSDDSISATIPRIHATLLFMEVSELIGDVYYTLSYAGEAMALSTSVSSDFVTIIIKLHHLRIYHRLQSRKYAVVISEMDDMIVSFDSDNMSSLIVNAMNGIVSIHDKEQDRTGISTDHQSLSFQYLYLTWCNTFEVTNRSDMCRHFIVPMAPSTKFEYYTLIHNVCHNSNKERTALAYLKKCDEYGHYLSFDVLRLIRRNACNELLYTNSLSIDDSITMRTSLNMQTALLNMASFGTSIEYMMKTARFTDHSPTDSTRVKSNYTNGTHNNVCTHIVDVISKSTSAYESSSSSVSYIERTLSSVLSKTNQHAFVSISINVNTNTVLISRYCEHCKGLVLSLPIADKLLEQITTWNTLIQECNRQLDITITTENAQDEKYKKDWWKKRRNIDEQIQACFSDMTSLLNVWRCILFTPQSFSFTHNHHQSTISMVNTLLSELSLSKYITEDDLHILYAWLTLVCVAYIDHDYTIDEASTCISTILQSTTNKALLKEKERAIMTRHLNIYLTRLKESLFNNTSPTHVYTESIVCHLSNTTEVMTTPDNDVCISTKDHLNVSKTGSKMKRSKEVTTSEPVIDTKPALPLSHSYTSVELNSMKVVQLKDLMTQLNLDLPGKKNKSDLIDCILQYYADSNTGTTLEDDMNKLTLNTSIHNPPLNVDTISSTQQLMADTSNNAAKLKSTKSSRSKEKSKPLAPQIHVPSDDDILDTTTINDIHIELPSSSSPTSQLSTPSSSHMNHTILLLDETLQSFPIENLPCMQAQPCCRVPGLASLLYLLHTEQSIDMMDNGSIGTTATISEIVEKESTVVRKKMSKKKDTDIVSLTQSSISSNHFRNTWYCIDPDGTLPTTVSTISTYLQPHITAHGWMGFVATTPTPEEFRKLHHDSALFLYFGHGGGEQLYDGRKLRKLTCPSAWLWGCSSGRLICHGVHDPHGIAVWYLLRGGQQVLGALWDVTDKDIDIMSVEVMRQMLDSTDTTMLNNQSSLHVTKFMPLSYALKVAQDKCKLKYAVGSSVVVYGLPFMNFSND